MISVCVRTSISFFVGALILSTWSLGCDQVLVLDKDNFLQKTWLVHASSVLLENNRATAGGLPVNDSDIKGIPFKKDEGIQVRTTHHNCLGSLVPDSKMGEGASILGLHITLPTSRLSQVPYVYMEPLVESLGKLVGGRPTDMYLFGDHDYQQRSICFIPKEDIELFHQRNPTYQGEVVTYQKDGTSLDTLIRQKLQEKNAWVYEFAGDPDPDFREYDESTDVKINGIPVDYKAFRTIFRNLGLWYGNHNDHPLGRLESLITYFNHAFHALHPKINKSPKDFILPLPHAKILRALIEYEFSKLHEDLKYLSSDRYQEFLGWAKDTRAWLDLYQLEYQLEKDKKSLFIENPEFSRFAKSRQDTNALNALSQELVSLNAKKLPNPENMFEHNIAISFFVPQYWQDILHLRSTNEAKEICDFIHSQIPDWHDAAAVLAHYCLTNIFKKPIKSPAQITPEIIDLFHAHAPQVRDVTFHKTKHEAQESFAELYFGFYNTNPDEKQLLAISNLPQVKQGLSIVLNLPHWDSLSEIKVDEILKHSPSTKQLYGTVQESSHEIYACGAFMKPLWLAQPVQSYQHAFIYAHLFNQLALELYVKPINPVAQGAFLSSLYEEAGISANTQVYKFIKAGTFGSLDTIFTSLNLQREFREKFSKDEDFWKSQNTFYSVYEQLKSKKL